MKVAFTTAELERVALKAGWMDPHLGASCIGIPLRAGVDPDAVCAAWRKNQPAMFYPHRRQK